MPDRLCLQGGLCVQDNDLAHSEATESKQGMTLEFALPSSTPPAFG